MQQHWQRQKTTITLTLTKEINDNKQHVKGTQTHIEHIKIVYIQLWIAHRNFIWQNTKNLLLFTHTHRNKQEQQKNGNNNIKKLEQ